MMPRIDRIDRSRPPKKQKTATLPPTQPKQGGQNPAIRIAWRPPCTPTAPPECLLHRIARLRQCLQPPAHRSNPRCCMPSSVRRPGFQAAARRRRPASGQERDLRLGVCRSMEGASGCAHGILYPHVSRDKNGRPSPRFSAHLKKPRARAEEGAEGCRPPDRKRQKDVRMDTMSTAPVPCGIVVQPQGRSTGWVESTDRSIHVGMCGSIPCLTHTLLVDVQPRTP